MKSVSKLLKLPMALLAISLLTSCGGLMADSSYTTSDSSIDVIDESEIGDKDDNKSRITITFDAGGGTFSTGMHTKFNQIRKGLNWGRVKGVAPTADDISYDKHTLLAWQIDDHGTKKDIEDSYIFTGNVILYARYKTSEFVNATFYVGDDYVDYYSFPDGSTTKYARFESGKTFKEIFGNAYTPKFNGYYWWDHKEFDYYLDDKGEKVTDDYKFNREGIKLTAQWKDATDEYETKDFCSDSWATFSKALNYDEYESYDIIRQNRGVNGGYGEDYAATSFTFNNKTYTKEADTFVGLMRNLKVNNKDYVIRVVDEMSDRLYDDDYTYATLTFEFVDIIETGVGYNYSSNPYNTWSDSFLEDYLNTQFLCQWNDTEASDLLVEVQKTTCKGKGSEKTSSTGDYCFIPSLKELGITEVEVASGTKIEIASEGLPRYTREGKELTWTYTGSYDYYYNEEGKTSRSRSLIKKDIDGNACKYFLRSPHTDTDSFVWVVNADGTINESSEVTVGLGISPMFCMGKQWVY